MTAFGIGSNFTFAYTYTPYDIPERITKPGTG